MIKQMPIVLKGSKSPNSRLYKTLKTAHVNGAIRQRAAPHGLSTDNAPEPDPKVMTIAAPKKAMAKPAIWIFRSFSRNIHPDKTAAQAGEVVTRTDANEGDR